MIDLKEFNEKLLYEAKGEKKEKMSSSFRTKKFRDNYIQYKGRISGTSKIEVDFKELRKILKEEVPNFNWTIVTTRKVFKILSDFIGIIPEEDEEDEEDFEDE